VVSRRRAYIAQRQARQESEKRALQLQTAAEIARETTGTLTLNDLLSRAVTLVGDRYGYYHAAIYLIDDTGFNVRIRAAAGAAQQELLSQGLTLPVGAGSVVGIAAKSGETQVNNQLISTEQTPVHTILKRTRSEMAIPMKIGARVIGVLDVHSDHEDDFTSEEGQVLQILADQLAVAVDNARSYEIANQAFQQARQRAQEMTLMFNVSQALSSAPLNPEEIAAIITEQFARVLEVPQCTLSFLINEDDRTLIRLLGAFGVIENPDQSAEERAFSLNDHPILQKAVDTASPIIAQKNDEGLSQHIKQFLQERGIQTLLALPLAVKGSAIGAIELISHQWPRYYSPDQVNLAMALANAAAVALENARLYEEQRQTAERLKEVDQLKTQFLANMSHELRTPLNSIIGFSRVILKGIDGPISEHQQQDLTAIYNSGQHLLNLINDILDLSKIEAGKMELMVENVNLNELVNSVMSTAVGLTKEKPIQLLVDVPEGLPEISIDRTRIRQVLINLIANAAKFTEAGYIKVSARLQSTEDDRAEIRVSVTDSGPGISLADQSKLFKAFSQVDASPTRKSGGTGLGLSISRHLVELHGGRMGVESEPEAGSTFFFTLPLQATATLKNEPVPQGVILSLDDNQQVIALYQRYLKDLGLQVIPVTDPAELLQLAFKYQPVAITLDLVLSQADGWKILEQIKQHPDTSRIPVIVCSILTEQSRASQLGAAEYLVKPILEDDLQAAVTRVLDHTSKPPQEI
jgi:signal transduction histidine kinase/putative methionine-R-sulfoxide reductase with GAF domain